MVTIKTKIVVLRFGEWSLSQTTENRVGNRTGTSVSCVEILHFGDPSIRFSADRVLSCFSLENSLLWACAKTENNEPCEHEQLWFSRQQKKITTMCSAAFLFRSVQFSPPRRSSYALFPRDAADNCATFYKIEFLLWLHILQILINCTFNALRFRSSSCKRRAAFPQRAVTLQPCSQQHLFMQKLLLFLLHEFLTVVLQTETKHFFSFWMNLAQRQIRSLFTVWKDIYFLSVCLPWKWIHLSNKINPLCTNFVH